MRGVGLACGVFAATAGVGTFSEPAGASPVPAAAVQPAAWRQVVGTPGHWRLAQDVHGVWWFLSPENEREFLNTVTTVQPFQRGRREQGPHFVSKHWAPGPQDAPADAEDAVVDAWAAPTLGRVRAAGFKGLGAWSHPVFHEMGVPMTRDLNVSTYVYGQLRRFYHDDWLPTAEAAVREQVTPLVGNRDLVGYYIDNELNWGESGAGPDVFFDHLAAGDPGRRAVMGVIRELWPTVEAFNANWHTGIAGFADLDTWPRLPDEPTDARRRLLDAWLEKLATDYFRETTRLIRKYDPDHLILGVRFKGWAPEAVVRGMKGHTDAVSLNYYVSDGQLDRELFTMLHEASGGQPLVITEYSFHALDGRSGNRNTFGFAAQVLDQQARADGYRLMTRRLAEVPWVVGADWFQWADEPPSGRTMDGEDVNFGVVDVDDREYDLLTRAVRETTPALNPLHATARADRALPHVWRPRFDRTPSHRVPYLADTPRIDGDVSDWPDGSLLPGVRRGATIGLDRSPVPLPEVRLGWREEGLYVALVVHDTDIRGAPADGWWWTRDAVELYLSSRPADEGGDRYTVHDHQFFFVPIAFPGKDGASGTVGRWARHGDALDAPLIPHPDVIDASRVLHGRYVAEMFIPAEAIDGFDPTHHPELAFNFHASDFQRAISYFWSAPKELRTQHRPSTWGTITLAPPADVYATLETE